MSLPAAALKKFVAIVEYRAETFADAWEQIGAVSWAWERASVSQRRRLRLASVDEAGLVERRKTRAGVEVSVYVAADAGIDSDPTAGKYALVCEHGGVVCIATRALARDHMAAPEGWCPYCRGDEP